jgi:hypothetical protein
MIAATSELVFSCGRLLQGQTELARVGIDASIAWQGRDYDVVRTKRRGWHYAIFKFRLLLRVEDARVQIPEPLALLLACWLAVNWENAPTGPAEGAAAGLVWGPGS